MQDSKPICQHSDDTAVGQQLLQMQEKRAELEAE